MSVAGDGFKFSLLLDEDVTFRYSKVRWNFSFVLLDFYRSPGNSIRYSPHFCAVILGAPALIWKR